MVKQFSMLFAIVTISSFLFMPTVGQCGGNVSQVQRDVMSKHSTKHCPARKTLKSHPAYSKGMEDDRRRYEKWCKMHPGQCSKKLKMF